MATTTAAVTLTSDLLSDALSVSTTTTCMKAGTEADGLDQMDMGYVEIATGDVYDILDATVLGLDKANKVYICNDSTDETYYVDVTVTADIAVDTAGDGDSAVGSAALGTATESDIIVVPSVVTTMDLEHMLFYE